MCPCPRQVPQARGTESSGYITEPEPLHAGHATVRGCFGTSIGSEPLHSRPSGSVPETICLPTGQAVMAHQGLDLVFFQSSTRPVVLSGWPVVPATELVATSLPALSVRHQPPQVCLDTNRNLAYRNTGRHDTAPYFSHTATSPFAW